MDEHTALERLGHDEVEVVAGRPTIVTAVPLKRAARERLSQLLDARVIDVREPCDRPDTVLTPACSPQLIGGLKRKYPGARIVVVELDDWDLDIELGGPVKRLLRSGADAYLLADSLDELAANLGSSVAAAEEHAAPAELPSALTVDDVVAAFLNGSVDVPEHHRRLRDDT